MSRPGPSVHMHKDVEPVVAAAPPAAAEAAFTMMWKSSMPEVLCGMQ